MVSNKSEKENLVFGENFPCMEYECFVSFLLKFFLIYDNFGTNKAPKLSCFCVAVCGIWARETAHKLWRGKNNI